MTYKNKVIFLVSLIAVFILMYTGSIVFSPERRNVRTVSYVWLDRNSSSRINKIVINTGFQILELVKNNNRWFVLFNGIEYPARQLRVDDFIGIFTTRSTWPIRSSNLEAHARLGLDETASRVTFYGDNTVLLDLLLGQTDSSVREINVRRFAHNEVRSGDASMTVFLFSPVTSWFNLRLIPESEDGSISAEDVQRFFVYNGGETQIFTRNQRSWDISGINVKEPDHGVIENYLRVIINTEGDNFVNLDSHEFNHSRIVLEFGNGRITTIRFSEPDEHDLRLAHVSGRDYIYSIPSWAAQRLFRDAESFEIR